MTTPSLHPQESHIYLYAVKSLPLVNRCIKRKVPISTKLPKRAVQTQLIITKNRDRSTTMAFANHNKVYALEHNPTIYVSVIKQFWQTVTVITLDNGEQELKAIIDTDEYTISESSVRNKLKLADENGITEFINAKIFEGMANLGTELHGSSSDFVHTPPSQVETSSPEPTKHTFEQPSTKHQLLLPRQEPDTPQSQDPSYPHVPEARSLTVEDLLYMVKKLENILKRRNVVLTTSEDEEPEDQGRIFKDIDDDPLVYFVTPTKPWKQLKLCQRLLLRGQNQLIRVKDTRGEKSLREKNLKTLVLALKKLILVA
ncbi:hypothetical protein Tco_0298907 [Tanacetum coccineum]